jgi:hypothetical protein
MDIALITGHEDLRSLKRYTHGKAKGVGEKLGWTKSKPAKDSPPESPLMAVRKDGSEVVVVIDGIEGRGRDVKEALALAKELQAMLRAPQ